MFIYAPTRSQTVAHSTMIALLLNFAASDEVICQTCLSIVAEGLNLAKSGNSIATVRGKMIEKCKKMDLYFRTGCLKLVEDYVTDIYNGKSDRKFSAFNICKKAKGCEDSDDPDTGTSDRYQRHL
jgi:hypothetical protein